MDTEDTFNNRNLTKDLLIFANRFRNYTHALNLSAELNDLSKPSLRESIIITCYSTIVIVSIFGNLLVCKIVASKASMRRTTYVLIANLALSDLLMTILNIPLNVARVLLDNWPFGGFMCSMVPLVQVTSVYVSTFTMMVIALDRYKVICKPLMPRIGPTQALKAIVLVWLISVVLSLPHAIFNKVETVFTYRPLVRCRSVYPQNFSLWITLVTFSTQYFLPLSITGLVYFFIVAKVWSRDVLGVVTEAQLVRQGKAKRKTIKMLVLVVIIFAICWLPLNVYHLLQEFTTLEFLKSSTIYFICHWLAMSSVCYNPFIYCWLNKNFRHGSIACFMCIRDVGRKLNTSFRSTREFRLTSFRCELESQSYDSRTDSVPVTKDTTLRYKTKQLNKSESLQVRSSMNNSKDFVPMVSFCVTKGSENLILKPVDETNCNGFFSTPDIQTSVDSQHCPLKKYSSWN